MWKRNGEVVVMRRRRDDAGSVSVEALMTLPVLMIFAALVMGVGWLSTGKSTVRSAANEAARAASIARTASDARAAAHAAAQVTLNNSDVRCAQVGVEVDTSGFSVAMGQSAAVQVTVWCDVTLENFGVPNLVDRRVSYTARSAIDSYRERG